MRTRLWTWWDTGTLVAYETVVVAIARIRASQPSEAVSAPTWLMFLSGLAMALPIAFLLDALGAGGSYGWSMMAAGSWIVSFRVADRWWTARVGTAT